MTDCLVCDTKYNPLEVYVVCNGCNALAHPKCISLNGRIADKIKEVPGLCWYCSSCRKNSPGVLLGQLRMIQSSFASLQREFSKVSSLLSSFESSLGNSHAVSAVEVSAPHDNDTGADLSVVSLRDDTTVIPPTSLGMVAAQGVTAPLINSKLKSSVPPEPSNLTVAATSSDMGGTSIPNLKELKRLPLLADNNHISCDPLPACHSLRAAQQPKIFFISRLDPSTSTRDVENYVRMKSKVDSATPIYCELLKSRHAHRLVSSFKITTTPSVFSSISSHNFWPENIIAHEFLPRKRVPRKRKRNGVTPQPAVTNKKN